jgi:exopolysaccharide production protein ExoZ
LPAYSASIIGQGWSLSYELYFYLCFALVLIRRSLIGLAALTGIFLLAVALRPLLATKEEFIALATSPLLIEFLAGVWIAYLLVTGWQVSRFTSHVLIVLSIALFAAGIAFGYTRLPSVITWGVPSALLVGGLVFAEHNEGLHRWLKMCSLLGDSSYSQYLLHGLIIEPLVVYALPNIKVPGGWIASIAICLVMPAICVALSVFSYEKVERKLAKFLQSKARNLRFYEVAQVPNQRRL